jgi:starch phosphorylase
MPVEAAVALVAADRGQAFVFCSEECRAAFLQDPAGYRQRSHEADGEANEHRRVAYFSMEMALEPDMPTYSGGLGVLAGDTLRAFADLSIPAVGVTLVHRQGYFQQHTDERSWQRETPATWQPEARLPALDQTVEVTIEGRTVRVRAFKYEVVGGGQFHVPVLLLDTDLPGNDDFARTLTGTLYGGDLRYRLAQEIVLGIGGVRMLRALGFAGIRKYHLNEGHASLAALELMRELEPTEHPPWPFERVRQQCVFTTHTPVPSGHDHFPTPLARAVLGTPVSAKLIDMISGEGALNMTSIALNLSGYINGVAARHTEISKGMFPGRRIHQVTNGVHSPTWSAPAFAALYDRYLPGWRRDATLLRNAIRFPPSEIWSAHLDAKTRLLTEVSARRGRALDPARLTIGFARRATHYKRMDLIFSDVERLRRIAGGRVQLLFAGKAHPQDGPGKEAIQHVRIAGQTLGDDVPVVFLEDHDVTLARLLVSGCDLWLNTPQRPMEASGTSGMKAAHNGVPSLSILDGWWIEGCVEGITGWSIGLTAPEGDTPDENRSDAVALYDRLERDVLPTYERERERWISIMQHTIALNASFFNTHRMVRQYATAYVD